jgi:hypothetical protein
VEFSVSGGLGLGFGLGVEEGLGFGVAVRLGSALGRGVVDGVVEGFGVAGGVLVDGAAGLLGDADGELVSGAAAGEPVDWTSTRPHPVRPRATAASPAARRAAPLPDWRLITISGPPSAPVAAP